MSEEISVLAIRGKGKGRGKPFQKGHKQLNTGRTHFKKGNHPRTEFKKGHKHTEEWKKRIGERMKGENHPNWKGGIAKLWYKRNKDKALMKIKKRRALKKGAEGSHTLGNWQTLKAQYNLVCPSCKRSEPRIKLTEDHIVPLSKGGSDNIENIQPLCLSCNSRKHVRIKKYATE